MRICHVVEAAGAGTGQVVSDLARLQRAEGHDVTVVYAPARAEPLFLDALNTIAGLKVLTSPMLRMVGVHDAWHAVALWRLLKASGPFDILHGHSSKAGALSRIAGLFLPHCKVVYTSHAFITMEASASFVYKPIEWGLSFLADALIATSEMEKDHAVRVLKIKADKVHVIWNGTRLGAVGSREEARVKLGVSEEAFLVGFVGRLAKQKNLSRLLDMFGLCLEKKPEAQLVILGDGEGKQDLLADIEARGMGKSVCVISGLRARDFYPAFDVLANSSDYESFGLILIEALAAGVPVVTTPVGVAAEAVIAGETGWPCSFEAQELAAGVLKIAGLDAAGKDAMRAACLERAKLFGDEAAGRKTMALYRALCGDARL